ncbi:MAG: hypothetical protein ABR526_08190 [Chthoniobacterales bacterium]
MAATADAQKSPLFHRARRSAILFAMPDSISDSEKALMRRWVDQWKNITGPAVERQKKEELRALTEADVVQRTKAVMNSRARPAKESLPFRNDSGLVEQQRIFSKGRAVPQ